MVISSSSRVLNLHASVCVSSECVSQRLCASVFVTNNVAVERWMDVTLCSLNEHLLGFRKVVRVREMLKDSWTGESLY